MQSFARALTAVVLLYAGTARADNIPVYDGAGFILTHNELDPFVDIDLLGETANSARFWLRGMETELSVGTDSSFQQYSYDTKTFDAYYGLIVKAGYKVTSITVTGRFGGELKPAEWTMPGDANNTLGFSFRAGGLYEKNVDATDLDGQQPFALTTAALEGETWVWLQARLDVGAASVWYRDDSTGEEFWLGSQAAADISGLAMTVNVAPVPEPTICGMVLAGLALIGYSRRARHAGDFRQVRAASGDVGAAAPSRRCMEEP